MKYLVLICSTALAITLTIEFSDLMKESMRQDREFRSETFRAFLEAKKAGPMVEIPTEPKPWKEKL